MGLGDLHHTTLQKCRILGTVSFLEKHHIPHFKSDIFRENGVSVRRGWQILHDFKDSEHRDRRHLAIETRGHKKLLSFGDIQAMERILWQYGFQARALTWTGLALATGISGISLYTIARAMGMFPLFFCLLCLTFAGTLGYRKCIACEKGFVSPFNAQRRVKAAQTALSFRPKAED